MQRLHSRAILKAKTCDLKRLPLGAREAFVLSQLDGRLTLEEVAEVAGLGVSDVVRLAGELVELGAAATARDSVRPQRGGVRVEEVRAARPDPRAERISQAPGRRSLRPGRPSSVISGEARHPEGTTRAPAKASGKSASIRPERRRTKPSLRLPRSTDERCELDPATLDAVVALDAALPPLDHYAVLEVDRGADRKAVKRAYFALAARFHPDRFFGKKLGKARAPLDRIFQRITQAHDTLSNAALRAEYDATLPPVARPAAPAQRSTAPPRRKSSKALRPSSRQLQATKKPTVRPDPPAPAKPTGTTNPPGSAKPTGTTNPEDRMRKMRAAAMEIKVQALFDGLVDAAEQALKKDDVIGAANNFRLALQHRDDPYVRMKLDDIDGRSRTIRAERNVLMARAAERDQRWADAGSFYAKAHEARPDAAMAERAAYALGMAGELVRAVALGEQAVALDGGNVAYRLTLGRVYLAASKLARAEAELSAALELAPKDARVKELGAAIAKQKAESR